MKKKIIHLLLFLIIFASLNSCQKKVNSNDLFGENIKTDKLDPVTLTIYMTSQNPSVQNAHTDLEKIFSQIEKKTKKTLNVKFDVKFIDPGHFEQKIQDVINGGEPCDLFVVDASGDFFNRINEQEMALDITTLFPRYAPDYYNRLDEGTLNAVSRQGKIVAVPSNYFVTNKPVVLVREDLFNKYDMPGITSINDLERFMDLVKEGEEKKYSLAINQYYSFMDIFAGYYGYSVLDWYPLGLVYKTDDPEMKTMAFENIPELVEIFEIAENWIRKDYYLKGINPYKTTTSIDGGIFAAYISRQLTVFEVNTILARLGRDFRYIEFPLFPGSPSQRYDYLQGLMINTYSENPERALKFIEWVHGSQENYDLLRYGIEGNNYSLNNNQLLLAEDEKSTNAYNYGDLLYPSFTDMEYERIYEGNSEAYRKQVLESYKEDTILQPHYGFRLDSSGMDVGRRRVSIELLYNKFVGMNKSAEETVEELRSDKNQKNTDNIVSIAQEQLDDWRKKQADE